MKRNWVSTFQTKIEVETDQVSWIRLKWKLLYLVVWRSDKILVWKKPSGISYNIGSCPGRNRPDQPSRFQVARQLVAAAAAVDRTLPRRGGRVESAFSAPVDSRTRPAAARNEARLQPPVWQPLPHLPQPDVLFATPLPAGRYLHGTYHQLAQLFGQTHFLRPARSPAARVPLTIHLNRRGNQLFGLCKKIHLFRAQLDPAWGP